MGKFRTCEAEGPRKGVKRCMIEGEIINRLEEQIHLWDGRAMQHVEIKLADGSDSKKVYIEVPKVKLKARP